MVTAALAIWPWGIPEMKLFAGALVAASLVAVPAFAQQALPPNNQLSTYGTIGYTYADGGPGAQFGVITGRLGVKKGSELRFEKI